MLLNEDFTTVKPDDIDTQYSKQDLSNALKNTDFKYHKQKRIWAVLYKGKKVGFLLNAKSNYKFISPEITVDFPDLKSAIEYVLITNIQYELRGKK